MEAVGLLLLLMALGMGEKRKPRDEEVRRALPAAPSPSKPRCKQMEPYFRQLAEITGGPVELFEAIAQRESSCDPKKKGRVAWGLFQVVPVVLRGWNKANPNEQYTLEDLLKPEVNTKVVGRNFQNILKVYNKVGEPPRWEDPRWVQLLIAGHNYGYSDLRGTSRGIRLSRERGVLPTLEYLQRNAEPLGMIYKIKRNGKLIERGGYWRDPRRLKWNQSVLRRYLQLRGQAAL